jgi:AcrR family transcriptional regulator
MSGVDEAGEDAVRRRTPRAEVRDRILEAAFAAFGRTGFERTSMEVIARDAGFTKGAVYSNFESKEELFLELMDRETWARAQAARDVVDSIDERDPLTTITEVGDLLTELWRSGAEWNLMWMEYVVLAMRDPKLQPGLAEHRRSLTTAVAEIIETYDLAGGVRPQLAASTVLAISNGLRIEHMIDPEAVPDSLLGGVLARLAGAS